jgi:hypothetical protein
MVDSQKGKQNPDISNVPLDRLVICALKALRGGGVDIFYLTNLLHKLFPNKDYTDLSMEIREILDKLVVEGKVGKTPGKFKVMDMFHLKTDLPEQYKEIIALLEGYA